MPVPLGNRVGTRPFKARSIFGLQGPTHGAIALSLVRIGAVDRRLTILHRALARKALGRGEAWHDRNDEAGHTQPYRQPLNRHDHEDAPASSPLDQHNPFAGARPIVAVFNN